MEYIPSNLELRQSLESRLTKAFGVRNDGTFFPGDVETAFFKMAEVSRFASSPWQCDMMSVLRRLQTYSRTDNPRDLADAVVMHCTLEETRNLQLELGYIARMRLR